MLNVVAMDDDREEADGAFVVATRVAAFVRLVSTSGPESGLERDSTPRYWVNGGGPCRDGALEEFSASVVMDGGAGSNVPSKGHGNGEGGGGGCRSCCTILVSDGC